MPQAVPISGLAATDPVRTVLDLARWYQQPEGLVLAEAAIACRLMSLQQLRAAVPGLHRLTGAGRARDVVAAARVGAQSPMETRLRVALAGSGLPDPDLQHVVRTPGGTFHVDLAWPSARVAVEYDGYAWHSGADAFVRDPATTVGLPHRG